MAQDASNALHLAVAEVRARVVYAAIALVRALKQHPCGRAGRFSGTRLGGDDGERSPSATYWQILSWSSRRCFTCTILLGKCTHVSELAARI